MTLDRLWAGWRTTYIDGVATQDRPTIPRSASSNGSAAATDAESLVLARNEHAFAVMNAYPYTSGHLMVAPLRHESTLADLTRDEAAAVMALVQDANVAHRWRRTGPTASTSAPTSAAPRVRACRVTYTCTCCHAGPATPTS